VTADLGLMTSDAKVV